jgi:exodeoxyribonuclease-3
MDPIMQVICASDYQVASPNVAGKAIRAGVFKDQRFSDHAPLTIDYDWSW